MDLPCSFCLSCYDEYVDCESCEFPEISKDGTHYRDTCDVCGNYIMIPMDARDRFNEIVCKNCAKLNASDLYGEPVEFTYGDCEDIYVEGTRRWWD